MVEIETQSLPKVPLEEFGGNGVDYSAYFDSSAVFQSDKEAIGWAKQIAIQLGFELIVSSHKKDGKKKLLRCSRGERYRGILRDPKKALRKNTKTKACGCKFQIVVGEVQEKGVWMVTHLPGEKGMHNHALTVYPEGYRQKSGLSLAAKKIIHDMSLLQAKPCAILATLQERVPEDNATIRHVYNYRDSIRRNGLEGEQVHSVSPTDVSEEEQRYFMDLVEEVKASDPVILRNISLLVDQELHPEFEVNTVVRGQSKMGASTKREPSRCQNAERWRGRGRSSYSSGTRGRSFSSSVKNYDNAGVQDARIVDFPHHDKIQPLILPYVEGYLDVTADGNCGFRIVASYIFGNEHDWWLVRRCLVGELFRKPELYRPIYVDGLEDAIARITWEGGHCGPEHWMTVTEDLFLIATFFNAAVFFFGQSASLCCTVLPLDAPSTAERPEREIVIHHLGRYQHFIRLCLSSNFPAPPIPMLWTTHRKDSVATWDQIYSSQREQWQRLTRA